MYRRFEFEGDIHASLECVPLAVRRKLDMAAWKISLAGWQTLSLQERQALCDLPVDSDAELEAYRQFMLAACERAAVPLKELVDPNAAAREWNAQRVPAPVALRAKELGAPLTDAVWVSLDQESRYALLKLTDAKRNPSKFHALLVELQLLAGPAPAIHASIAVCDSSAPQR